MSLGWSHESPSLAGQAVGTLGTGAPTLAPDRAVGVSFWVFWVTASLPPSLTHSGVHGLYRGSPLAIAPRCSTAHWVSDAGDVPLHPDLLLLRADLQFFLHMNYPSLVF